MRLINIVFQQVWKYIFAEHCRKQHGFRRTTSSGIGLLYYSGALTVEERSWGVIIASLLHRDTSLFVSFPPPTRNEEDNVLNATLDSFYYGFCHLSLYFLTVQTPEKGKELIRLPEELGYTACGKPFSYAVCSVSVGSRVIAALNLICLALFHLDAVQTHCLQLPASRVGNQSLY